MNNQFATAYSTHADARLAVRECLNMLPSGHNATLGFVYATDYHAQALPGILQELRDDTGVSHWTGTLGMGICFGDQAFMDEPALAVMLADFPEDAFCIFGGIVEQVNEIQASLAHWPAREQACLTVVHGDPNNPGLPALVESLPDELGNGFLVGGLTSSRQGNLQVADTITRGGLSGVVFHQDVAVATALSQGCTPISPVHEITDCQHNILAELDGQPALDVFNDDIGELLARDLQKIAGYIFVARPVQGVDTGDYTVRNLLGIDPDKKLLAVGDVFEQGDEIMFCRRDNHTALEDMERMLTQLRNRIGEQQPRGALYFTCLGRGEHMFGSKSRELEIIREQLGEIPLVGFYANGEISRDRLYGYTGVLTLFL